MLKLTISSSDIATQSVPGADDPEVQVWRDTHGNVCVCTHTLDGQHWIHFPRFASFSFESNSDEMRAFPHRHIQPELIHDVYYRYALPIALQALGTEVLHASAVILEHGVVALCAHSGMGKSTTAFGLRQRGYALWADDTVAFETSDPCVKSMPLPFEIHLEPDAAQYFSRDLPSFSSQLHQDSFSRAKWRPLLALLLLQRVRAASDSVAVEVVRLSSTQALPAVLPYAHCFSLTNVEQKRRMVVHYLELTTKVPVFEVHFQAGLEKLPLILDRIEQVIHQELKEAI